MINSNALVSTAMLGAIWEKEKKDTIELILPFVQYSIGKTTSINNRIDVKQIQEYMGKEFGFDTIPYSVLQNAFVRLKKKKVIIQQNREFILANDVTEFCQRIDVQKHKTNEQTKNVLSELTGYLNKKKEKLFKKDLDNDDTKKILINFLERNGYLVYVDVIKMGDITQKENTYFYHIAQFILKEHMNRTVLFSSFMDIIVGLLLSKVIYGYSDINIQKKFQNICVYIDTSLILGFLGYKTTEENATADQLKYMLNKNDIPIKCFIHNYSEVYRIVEAYKYSLSRPNNTRNGQTLEYFDYKEYSTSDIERVLSFLEDNIREKGIDVVDDPSMSNNASGLVTSQDFDKAIGEKELKDYLAREMRYSKDQPLENDVKSISSIYILRNGINTTNIENCRAIFVTSNLRFATVIRKYENESNKRYNSVPLCISDLELTTLLWLKNHKRFSAFPMMRIIETARLSTEPTEQIRIEFIKKVEMIKKESNCTEEMAAGLRRIIYNNKEDLMELIAGNPENISSLEPLSLEQMAKEYYNSETHKENEKIKLELEGQKKVLAEGIECRVNKATKAFDVAYNVTVYSFTILILLFGLISTVVLAIDEKTNNWSLLSLLFLGFGWLC